MSTIHFKQTTTATPEQFIAGLTDFGPGRGKIFGNSTDEYLKVHKKGTNYCRRHRGLGRHLGTAELQLVRSHTHCPYHHGLELVGRPVRSHLYA